MVPPMEFVVQHVLMQPLIHQDFVIPVEIYVICVKTTLGVTLAKIKLIN